MSFRRSFGFTLIEILVVIAIIGILAASITVYALRGSATSRDAKRQTDLKLLQAAVEAYKSDNGRYPDGCRGANNWSGETGTSFECSSTDKRYIVGLAPKYIRNLPRDPNRGACKDTTSPYDCGYAYVTNAEGSVYKIIAMNTVEGEVVTPAHPLKSCDFNSSFASGDIRDGGYCGALVGDDQIFRQMESDSPAWPGGTHVCKVNNSRFQYSYAVWGGYAELRGTLAFGSSGTADSCFSGYCINPKPLNLTEDPLNTFITTAGAPTTISSAATKNNLRARAVRGTTEVICK